MALVLNSEAQAEVTRVMNAETPFDVLRLSPSLASAEEVKKAYDRIMAVLRSRELIRSPDAQRARAKVDHAKAVLSDPTTRGAEQQKVLKQLNAARDERDMMARIASRTAELESRAANAAAISRIRAAEDAAATVAAEER
jgi:curved DNA-binding protein CbpA